MGFQGDNPWTSFHCFKGGIFLKEGTKRIGPQMENPGIDLGTSRMQSGRFTTWANFPILNIHNSQVFFPGVFLFGFNYHKHIYFFL